jgi:hypothetical protein
MIGLFFVFNVDLAILSCNLVWCATGHEFLYFSVYLIVQYISLNPRTEGRITPRIQTSTELRSTHLSYVRRRGLVVG